MISNEQQYLSFLSTILKNGHQTSNRTGIDTISIPFHQMRFDLTNNKIPLLTTKKMHTHSIIHELLWFLSGTGSSEYLENNNVRIWKEWTSPDGHLDYVYGYQWRRWPTYTEDSMVLVNNYEDTINDRPLPDSFTLDNSQYDDIVIDLWHDIRLHRTTTRWKNKHAFIHDIKYLPGYIRWRDRPDLYTLVPNYHGTSSIFSRETSAFVSNNYADELSYNSDGKLYIVNTNNNVIETHSFSRACELADITQTASTIHIDANGDTIHVCSITNNKIICKTPPPGKLYRKQLYIDQIESVINKIKHDPSDRRIIISAWNVGLLNEMALPPCHAFIQFYVNGDELSCHLYQRSADAFLGVPFNIAQYSILTHLIAKITGKTATEFVWTGGDCHIYTNHKSAIETQLSRTPYSGPTISINGHSNIDDYVFEDFNIVDYKCHDIIRAPVAV